MPVDMRKTKVNEQNLNVNVNDKNKDTGQLKNYEAVMQELNIGSPDDFNKQLSIQWKNAVREKKLISVLLCEIDFYPEYLENYGVQGTSFMLISMALILKNVCNKHNCFLSRNQKHGFSILLEGGTEQEVRSIADSLCQAVKNSKTEHKHSSIENFITLSIGISSLYPNCKVALKGTAKKSLNIAKTSGGNKVNIIKTSLQMMPEDFTLNEEIRFPPTGNIDSKRRELVIEKQKTNAVKSDFFAESEKNSVKINPKLDKNSQVHSTKKNIEGKNKDALKSNKTALNQCNDKNKKEQVRMYRGQIITS